jgi:hypothetical protein
MTRLFVGTLVGCLLFTCTAFGEWYAGGTLHKVTGSAWQKATAKNRLATSADFVAAAVKGGHLSTKLRSVDDLRPYAAQLSTCITNATNTKAAYNLRVSEVAASCMILMGWK